MNHAAQEEKSLKRMSVNTESESWVRMGDKPRFWRTVPCPSLISTSFAIRVLKEKRDCSAVMLSCLRYSTDLPKVG